MKNKIGGAKRDKSARVGEEEIRSCCEGEILIGELEPLQDSLQKAITGIDGYCLACFKFQDEAPPPFPGTRSILSASRRR